VLLAGEVETEQFVQSLCTYDENANPRYRIDYNKYMAKVNQAANTPGGPVSAPV